MPLVEDKLKQLYQKKSKEMVIIGEKGVSIQERKDVFITIVNECIV